MTLLRLPFWLINLKQGSSQGCIEYLYIPVRYYDLLHNTAVSVTRSKRAVSVPQC